MGKGESGDLVEVDPVVAAVVENGADLPMSDREEDLRPWEAGRPGCFGDLHTIGHGFRRGYFSGRAARQAGALAQKVGVRCHGAPERSDVHDVIVDVHDLGHGADLAGPDDDVGAGDEAGRVDRVVEESPGQAGVVHGVQVDDQIEVNRGAHVQSAKANSKTFSSGETAVTSAILGGTLSPMTSTRDPTSSPSRSRRSSVRANFWP